MAGPGPLQEPLRVVWGVAVSWEREAGRTDASGPDLPEWPEEKEQR